MYNEQDNTVIVAGVLYPHNPATGEPWDAESAAEYLQQLADAQTASDESTQATPFQLTLVATAARMKVGGTPVEIQQPFNLIVVEFGKALEVDVEVQDGSGNLVTHVPDGLGGMRPLSQTFVLPIPGLFGTPMEVVDVVFNEGQATAEVTFPAPGMWKVTSEQVNMHIEDPAAHFAFAGLEFKAKRPTV